MKAFHLPVFAENPYQKLLRDHLERIDVETVAETRAIPLAPFVHRMVTDDIDVIHLHWTHPYFLVGSWTRFYALPFAKLGCWLFAAVFVAQLTVAAAIADRLVWTVHNEHNHERRYLDIDAWVAGRVARLADGIQAWDEQTARTIRDEFDVDRDAITIIPHGHYLDYYDVSNDSADPRPVGRSTESPASRDAHATADVDVVGDAAPLALAAPEADADPTGSAPDVGRRPRRSMVDGGTEGTTYLFFGMIRGYKNVPELIEAFVDVESADARLVIAGNPYTEAVGEAVREAADGHDNVTLHLEYIPDEAVPEYFDAADVAVFPYRNVFNSGSVFLAMSFATAFVAPNMGSIPSVAPAGNIIYDDLREGLRRARAMPRSTLHEVGRRNRLVAERDYDWDDIARLTAWLYAGEPLEPPNERVDREPVEPVEA